MSQDSGSEFFEANSMVLAVDVESNRQLARELEGKVEALCVIGDAAVGDRIGRTREAIASKFEIGSKIWSRHLERRYHKKQTKYSHSNDMIRPHYSSKRR